MVNREILDVRADIGRVGQARGRRQAWTLERGGALIARPGRERLD